MKRRRMNRRVLFTAAIVLRAAGQHGRIQGQETRPNFAILSSGWGCVQGFQEPNQIVDGARGIGSFLAPGRLVLFPELFSASDCVRLKRLKEWIDRIRLGIVPNMRLELP